MEGILKNIDRVRPYKGVRSSISTFTKYAGLQSVINIIHDDKPRILNFVMVFT